MNQHEIDQMVAEGMAGVMKFKKYFESAPENHKPYLYFALCSAATAVDVGAFSNELRKADGYIDALRKIQGMRRGEFGIEAQKAYASACVCDKSIVIPDSAPDWLKYTVAKWKEDATDDFFEILP